MIRMLLRGAFPLWLFVITALPASAHDARPVFIQITEQAPQQFLVEWKVPISVPDFALPRPVLPGFCTFQGMPVYSGAGDGHGFRQESSCAETLAGNEVGIEFPDNNPGLNTMIRVHLLSGELHTGILKPGQSRWQVPEAENFTRVATQYALLGIEHIFAGIDHLLFVACLVFIAGTPRRILVTITGFTLSHSLTLALSALELVRLPVPPVEAAIALSIVFLAHEIAVGNKRSWTWRFPLLVSVSFGFLHGFGFASVLRDIGLPQVEQTTGLLFFNIGVEISQVLFIAAILTAVALLGKILGMDRRTLLAHRRSIALSSYLIGITASFWLVERVAGFAP